MMSYCQTSTDPQNIPSQTKIQGINTNLSQRVFYCGQSYFDDTHTHIPNANVNTTKYIFSNEQRRKTVFFKNAGTLIVV